MADAQFAIDVAATMSGDETSAELDKLTRKLIGAGVESEGFERAMQHVGRQLKMAQAATATANEALREGNQHYAQLEKAALKAAQAFEKAQTQAKGSVPIDVKRNADATAKALSAYTEELRKLEQNAAAAKTNQAQLAATLSSSKSLYDATNKAAARLAATEKDRAAKAQKIYTDAVAEANRQVKAKAEAAARAATEEKRLADASGKSARELIGLGKVDKVAKALMSVEGAAVVAIGVTVAVAAAIVAVTVAAIAGAAALTKWAVSLADARREAALSAEAFDTMNADLAPLRGQINEMAGSTGQTAAELQTLAKSLKAAKVSAADMPAALKAAALAEKALGKGGSADFIKQIQEGKRSVSDLSSELSGKLGPIVAKQMRGLDAQSARLKTNLGGIFGGLNIDPVLDGMQRLVSLFDQNTAAGETIKFLFESIFQPLINQAEKAAIVIEAFALGFLIGLTKVYIAVKPAIRAIAEFLGFDDPVSADTLSMVTKAAEFAAYGVVALGVAFATLAAMALLPIAAIALVVKGLYDFGKAAVSLGTDLIMGLVKGISNAAGAVVDAVTGAVRGAIDAAKRLLGIASPSKVFAEIGVNTGEGFAMGVDDSASTAQASLANMVSPTDLSAPGGAATAGAAAAGGGGALVDLRGAQLHFHGVKDGPDSVERFSEMLTRALEGDAAQLGATVPA